MTRRIIPWLAMTTTALAAEPPAHRGLYAIWYGRHYEVLDMPYVVGGQAVVQWADLEPRLEQRDFSKLDAALAVVHQRHMPATVQVNGNRKPQWLFRRVPYHPKKLSVQIADEQGSLMYWHPVHRQAYVDFLHAYATHLKTSPLRNSILGVRMNFNALGTEHSFVPPPYRDPAQWITPPGVAAGPAYSKTLANECRAQVVSAFVREFRPEIRVFVRNNIDDAIRKTFRRQFDAGELCWFHTSSEVQPRSKGVERQYLTFLADCRAGKTLGYAEPWASAWGHHGPKTDERWCSPPQWNYWRLLCDLHCGVSFIAVYSSDLEVARTGVYSWGRNRQQQDAHRYQAEFDAAFRFAARYAGYHASPRVSPGAWIAFREGDFLRGDYTFLMHRSPTHPAATMQADDSSEAVQNVGPEDQRFGAWARVLPEGGLIRLTLDPAFAASLDHSPCQIRLTYLDNAPGLLELRLADQTHLIPTSTTSRWQTHIWALPRLPANVLLLRSLTSDHTLHMVEIARGAAS